MALVSISDSQRRPMPVVNWAATIPHGLPADLLPFTPQPKGGYLAFLGRISPEKRPDRAIDIAARAGLPLKIAAKVDNADRAYWDMFIAPLIARHDNVEFVGEINDDAKASFLGNARALLFPIDWPEPFGLVMIEAMACGTPVVAWNCGSVPEVIDDGVTGFIVDNEAEAMKAVRRLEMVDRGKVRSMFETRFTVERMAADYLSVYRSLSGVRRDAARLRRIGGKGQSLQAVA
jgi:glycosyltransferase involved in cell wall biosynthesis